MASTKVQCIMTQPIRLLLPLPYFTCFSFGFFADISQLLLGFACLLFAFVMVVGDSPWCVCAVDRTSSSETSHQIWLFEHKDLRIEGRIVGSAVGSLGARHDQGLRRAATTSAFCIICGFPVCCSCTLCCYDYKRKAGTRAFP